MVETRLAASLTAAASPITKGDGARPFSTIGCGWSSARMSCFLVAPDAPCRAASTGVVVGTDLKSIAIPYHRGLHRFAIFTSCVTLLLIVAGALVTSNDAGLSVPDWPTSFGSWYKMPQMVGGIL